MNNEEANLIKITDDSGYTITSVEVPRGYHTALAAKHAFWAALEEGEVEWHTLGDWYCTIDGRTFRHEVTSNAVEVK